MTLGQRSLVTYLREWAIWEFWALRKDHWERSLVFSVRRFALCPQISLHGCFLSSMKGPPCHCVIMMPWHACPLTIFIQQLWPSALFPPTKQCVGVSHITCREKNYTHSWVIVQTICVFWPHIFFLAFLLKLRPLRTAHRSVLERFPHLEAQGEGRGFFSQLKECLAC